MLPLNGRRPSTFMRINLLWTVQGYGIRVRFNFEFLHHFWPELFNRYFSFIIRLFTESANLSVNFLNLLIPHSFLTGVTSIGLNNLSYLWLWPGPSVPSIIEYRFKSAILHTISFQLCPCRSNVFLVYLALFDQQIWVVRPHIVPLQLLLYLLKLIFSNQSRVVIQSGRVIEALSVLKQEGLLLGRVHETFQVLLVVHKLLVLDVDLESLLLGRHIENAFGGELSKGSCWLRLILLHMLEEFCRENIVDNMYKGWKVVEGDTFFRWICTVACDTHSL